MANITTALTFDADDKAQHLEVPAGTNFARLNDGAAYPAAVDMTTNYIEISDDTSIGRSTLTTRAMGGGEVGAGLIMRAYIQCDIAGQNRGIRFQITHDVGAPTAILDKTIPAGTAEGWQILRIVAPLTQAQIDSLKLTISGSVGTGVARVGKVETELYTSTHKWAAADDKMTFNRNVDTGLSIGAGPLGFDAMASCDLDGTRQFFIIRDMMWATAAGRQRILDTNPASPGAPASGFVRSGVALLSGKNVDTSAFTFFTGAGATSYFPDVAFGGTTCIRWPQMAFKKGARLFVVGMLDPGTLAPIGRWVGYCDDWSANPTNPALWTWTYPALYGPGVTQVNVGANGIWNNSAGDGYVYMFDDGSLFVQPHGPRIARMLEADFDSLQWVGKQEWLDFDGSYKKDRAGGWSVEPLMPINRRKRRVSTFDTGVVNILESINEGLVYRRASDNKFVYGGLFDATWLWNPVTLLLPSPFDFEYVETAGTVPGKFVAPRSGSKHQISAVEDWCYFGTIHDTLTFTGAGADDKVGSYNGNSQRGNGWETAYFPKWCKLASVT